MPVTRSGSMRSSAEPQPTRKRTNRASREVIVISSDSEEEPTPPPPPPRSKKRKSPRTSIGPGDSSELEVVDEGPSDEVTRLRKRLKAAEKSCNTYINQVDSLRAQARKAQRTEKELQDKLAATVENYEKRYEERMKAEKTQAKTSSSEIRLEDIEDNITCEVCTMKMWSPYILSECGHTFCQKCLTDWFSTTHANHLATHPTYNVAMPRADPTLLAHLPRYMQQAFAQVAVGPPPPAYTCPTCRARVTRAPTECFAIKNIVHAVASKLGEKDPHAVPVRRGKARAPTGGPWDGFFRPS